VIDTISALRVLAPTPAFYRRQLRRIRDFLYARSCTTLLLDDASLGEKDSRSQTIADGILELRQIDYSFGSDRRRLRVRKMRGATYVAGAHDFTIQTGGLTVYPRLVAQEYAKQPRAEPLRSGVAEIDALSGGGLPRGTATLVLGPAGIGKSTLTMLYAMAAARQNEHCSILLFDESAETYIARSRGLGFDIERAIESGRIRLHHLDPAELSSGRTSVCAIGTVRRTRKSPPGSASTKSESEAIATGRVSTGPNRSAMADAMARLRSARTAPVNVMWKR
jgi:circadian clock protein KaiC